MRIYCNDCIKYIYMYMYEMKQTLRMTTSLAMKCSTLKKQTHITSGAKEHNVVVGGRVVTIHCQFVE